MGKDAVNWLLEFFNASGPGPTLIQIAVAFSVTFLAAKAFYALCERVAFRRPLPWSSHMLSMLIAAVFWAPLLVFANRRLEILAASLNGNARPALEVDWSLAEMFGAIFAAILGGIFLVAPFSLLIVPILLLYLFYPPCLRERATRMTFVYVVIAATTANYFWQLAWNSHSS